MFTHDSICLLTCSLPSREIFVEHVKNKRKKSLSELKAIYLAINWSIYEQIVHAANFLALEESFFKFLHKRLGFWFLCTVDILCWQHFEAPVIWQQKEFGLSFCHKNTFWTGECIMGEVSVLY